MQVLEGALGVSISGNAPVTKPKQKIVSKNLLTVSEVVKLKAR